MLSNLEKFSSLSKARMEFHLAALNVQANKAVAVGEQVMALNSAAAKAYLDESKVVAQQLLSAKDPKEFFALVNSQAMQSAEKAAAYGALCISLWNLQNRFQPARLMASE